MLNKKRKKVINGYSTNSASGYNNFNSKNANANFLNQYKNKCLIDLSKSQMNKVFSKVREIYYKIIYRDILIKHKEKGNCYEIMKKTSAINFMHFKDIFDADVFPWYMVSFPGISSRTAYYSFGKAISDEKTFNSMVLGINESKQNNKKKTKVLNNKSNYFDITYNDPYIQDEEQFSNNKNTNNKSVDQGCDFDDKKHKNNQEKGNFNATFNIISNYNYNVSLHNINNNNANNIINNYSYGKNYVNKYNIVKNSKNDIVLYPIEEENLNNLYCYCKKKYDNGLFMIACSNEETCPNNGWFHPECVDEMKGMSKSQIEDENFNFTCKNCRLSILKNTLDTKSKSNDKDDEIINTNTIIKQNNTVYNNCTEQLKSTINNDNIDTIQKSSNFKYNNLNNNLNDSNQKNKSNNQPYNICNLNEFNKEDVLNRCNAISNKINLHNSTNTNYVLSDISSKINQIYQNVTNIFNNNINSISDNYSNNNNSKNFNELKTFINKSK